jgi:hypothetical protein
VKIPAANMLANVGQFIPEGQLLFIATDERNKSFFDAFHSRFPRIRYLDDFMDYAELRSINPNFLGERTRTRRVWHISALTLFLGLLRLRHLLLFFLPLRCISLLSSRLVYLCASFARVQA